MKYYSSILIAAVAAILFGCSAPKIAQLPAQRSLPNTYTSTTDTAAVNIAAIPWKTFFPDPQMIRLIDTAIANNPDLQIAAQRIKVAGAYLSMAKGALLPSVSATVSASGTHYGKYTMDGVGNYDTNLSDNINDNQKINETFSPNFWLGFNTSWEADIWGKLRDQKKAEAAKYLASAEGRNAVLTALVSQVAGLYYTLQGLDKEQHIIQQNIILQQKALENVQALMEGGRATQLAHQQFLGQLLNTKATALTVQQQVIATENQLNALLGRFGNPILRDSIYLKNTVMDSLHVGFPAQILENRPDIREAGLLLAASRANLSAARAAFFPSFTIDASGAFNAFKGSLLFSGSSLAYSILGGISAPVFQKNKIKAAFNIATAEQETAFYQYQKNVLNAYQEVATSLNKWTSNKKIAGQKSLEVKALEDGVVTANDLYIGGYAGYLEIIAAQKSMLQAQLELVFAQRESMLSLVDIYRSVGGGWKE